jgi:hypothetical protein
MNNQGNMSREKKLLSSSKTARKKADLWNEPDITQSNSLNEGQGARREYR